MREWQSKAGPDDWVSFWSLGLKGSDQPALFALVRKGALVQKPRVAVYRIAGGWNFSLDELA